MLLLDVGHTRIKWAACKNGVISHRHAHHYKIEQLDEQLAEWFSGFSPAMSVYIACVADAGVKARIQNWFERDWQGSVVFVQAQAAQAGVKNGYVNPQQLGVDRWLAMLAAYEKHHRAVCVIDCGTAVTLDIINDEGLHLGGLIIPGLSMMLDATSSNLNFKVNSGKRQMLASDTSGAVYNGCLNILLLGLRGLYQAYVEQLPGMLCVLTGGDANLLAEHLACDCEVELDLVLSGLEIYAEANY